MNRYREQPVFEDGKPLFAEQLNQLADLSWQTRLITMQESGTGLTVLHNSSVDKTNNYFSFEPQTSMLAIKGLCVTTQENDLLVAEELSEFVPRLADTFYLTWKMPKNVSEMNIGKAQIVFEYIEDPYILCLKVGEIDRSTSEPKLRVMLPVVSMDASYDLCRLHKQFITLLEGLARDLSKSKRGDASHRHLVFETASHFLDHCWNVNSQVWMRQAKATLRALHGFLLQNCDNTIERALPDLEELQQCKPNEHHKLIDYIKTIATILDEDGVIRPWLRDDINEVNLLAVTETRFSHIGSLLYDFNLTDDVSRRLRVIIDGIQGRPYNVGYSFDEDAFIQLIFNEHSPGRFSAEVHLDSSSGSKLTLSVPKPGRPQVSKVKEQILQ